MRILVCTKRVPDSDQPIHVGSDPTSLRLDNVPFVLNPFDAIALEEALRLREGPLPQAEIVAVGVGPIEYQETLRTALAMGADRGLLVCCQAPLDPANVSRILAGVVRREAPGLVLMGKQAVDDDANQTGQFLAARLGWPQATFASRIEWLGDRVRVARETDGGIEWLRVSLPAVVTVDLRLNEPRVCFAGRDHASPQEGDRRNFRRLIGSGPYAVRGTGLPRSLEIPETVCAGAGRG